MPTPSAETAQDVTAWAMARHDAEEFTLADDARRPVTFHGWELGEGGMTRRDSARAGVERTVDVLIYLTTHGALVATVTRGETSDAGWTFTGRELHRCDSIPALVDALRTGKRGEVGPASLDALTAAVERCPPLAPALDLARVPKPAV